MMFQYYSKTVNNNIELLPSPRSMPNMCHCSSRKTRVINFNVTTMFSLHSTGRTAWPLSRSSSTFAWRPPACRWSCCPTWPSSPTPWETKVTTPPQRTSLRERILNVNNIAGKMILHIIWTDIVIWCFMEWSSLHQPWNLCPWFVLLFRPMKPGTKSTIHAVWLDLVMQQTCDWAGYPMKWSVHSYTTSPTLCCMAPA